jgi:nondiscriminating glutamyl-tRNA synthetase
MPIIKTRFAPSPTGLIHIGNARTALFSALFGDSFLLRIEDSDEERSRPQFVADLLEDLSWLGLCWDEGPDSAEPSADYFQSRRSEVYQRYYAELERQALAYPCFCTPSELEIARKVQLSAGQPPRYSGKCARLSPEDVAEKLHQGMKPTLRFRVHKEGVVEFNDRVRGLQVFNAADIGDFIIRRADGSAAFFFCNAIDDALMGVTHVLRGEDHLSNTPRQVLVLEALRLPVPEYAHISLILGDDGAPLSKRNGSRSVNQLREEGYLPLAVLNTLARLGHHYERADVMNFQALKRDFELSHLSKSPARFDMAHLKHWQQEAVRIADEATLWNWLRTETRALIPNDRRAAFLDIVRSNCAFPAEAHAWAKILFSDEIEINDDAAAILRGAGESFFLHAIDAANRAPGDFGAFVDELKKTSGARGKRLFQPLRAALTGRLDGPEIARVYAFLDKRRLERRLAEFTYESL